MRYSPRSVRTWGADIDKSGTAALFADSTFWGDPAARIDGQAGPVIQQFMAEFPLPPLPPAHPTVPQP
jgi:hypothetical protein